MNPIHVKGIHHVELYVGNARQAEYYYRQAFGFRRFAYSGLETGWRDKTSFALQQGKARLLVTAAYSPDSPVGAHVLRHGDGVRDIALEVDDAEAAFAEAIRRGAEPAEEPHAVSDANGTARRAAVKIYGDTIHSFISIGGYRGPFLPGFVASEVPGREAGLLTIDHYVANVTLGEMRKWEDWYTRVLGLERFMTFDDTDISTEFTALNSVVMANAARNLKFPINEPAPGRRKSQVEEYNDFYGAPGVQHIALLTSDILRTVGRLRDNGVDFLTVPDAYYEALEARVGKVDEGLDRLRDLGLLVDRDEDGYLLQIFTKPVEDRPTLFFEIIQRKGCQGFGKGNFKALFEAIESEQARRGNLV